PCWCGHRREPHQFRPQGRGAAWPGWGIGPGQSPAGGVRPAPAETPRAGRRLGLAAGAGSGKSTLALSVLRLLKPPGRVAAGEVWLDGVNLMTLAEEDMRQGQLAPAPLVPPALIEPPSP